MSYLMVIFLSIGNTHLNSVTIMQNYEQCKMVHKMVMEKTQPPATIKIMCVKNESEAM